MDAVTGATGNTWLPTFQRFGQSAPYHVNWLPSLKALKIQKRLARYMFSAISEGLSFKISRGAPPTDFNLGNSLSQSFVVSLAVLSPNKVLKSHWKKHCQGAPQSMRPHFVMLPTSLGAEDITCCKLNGEKQSTK